MRNQLRQWPRKAPPFDNSFKGLAAYLMKGERGSVLDRADWATTINLMDAPPEKAWRLMASTAMSAEALKSAAGIVKGNRTKKAVYHYSLNFNPNDMTTPELYRAAVEGSLKALGLEDYQALAIAHHDTKHVHAMVNLINPETGMSASSKQGDRPAILPMTQKKLGQWAERFEREHGLTITEGRIANQTARSNGQLVDAKRKPRQVYEAEKREGNDERLAWLRKQQDDRRAALLKEHADIRERQRIEWEALKAGYQIENDGRRRAQPTFKAIIAGIHRETKPESDARWRRHRDELREFQKSERSTGSRLFNIAITLARLGREGRGVKSLTTAFSAKEREQMVLRRQQAKATELREKISVKISAALEAQKISDAKAWDLARQSFLDRCAELRQAHDQQHMLMRDQWKNYNESRKSKIDKARAPLQERGVSQDMGRGTAREI